MQHEHGHAPAQEHGHKHHEHAHDGKACTHEHEVHESHAHDSKAHGHHDHGHGHKHDAPLSGGVITVSSLEDKLRASPLAPSHVSVTDESDGCGSKFAAIVVSESFEGMALIDRHRAVQDLLGSEIAQIHAFQVRAGRSGSSLGAGAAELGEPSKPHQQRFASRCPVRSHAPACLPRFLRALQVKAWTAAQYEKKKAAGSVS
jgi:stress-induced morphogen